MISADDRNWAIYANAAGLLVFTNIPFVSVAATLYIWLRFRHDESMRFAFAHAALALRTQIMWTALVIVGIIFTYHDLRELLITYLALCVLNAIVSVIGCWRASDKKWV